MHLYNIASASHTNFGNDIKKLFREDTTLLAIGINLRKLCTEKTRQQNHMRPLCQS